MKIIFIFIIFSVELFSSVEYQSGIGFGPSFSYEPNNKTKILGFDLSYTGFGSIMNSIKIPTYMTVSLNPKIFNYQKENKDYGIDIQTTLYYIFNFGGGFGYLIKENNCFTFHLFLGLPFGIIDYSRNTLFGFYYIEPYYRLNYTNNHYSNEFGVMIKINTFKQYLE
jgi:hypothetical protein